MDVFKIVVGALQTNCYIFATGNGEALVIDPADEPERIDKLIQKARLSPIMIVNSHHHFDHVGGNYYFHEKYNIPLAIGVYDADFLKRAHIEARVFLINIKKSPLPDILLKDSDRIRVGNDSFLVLHTPGHTPGSICLYSEKNKILFSGDTLFFESVGRWDLPGGNYNALMESLDRLLSLPDDTVVYPGHGPETTIGHEKRFNPFVK